MQLLPSCWLRVFPCWSCRLLELGPSCNTIGETDILATKPPDQCNLAGPRAAALKLCETSPAVAQVHAEGNTSTRCSLPIPGLQLGSVAVQSRLTSQINGHDLTSRAAWTQLIASVGNYSDQLLSRLQREMCASSGCAEDSAATAGGATHCTRCTPGRSIHFIHDDAGMQPASTPTPRPLQLASKCVGLHTWWFELVHCAHASGEHAVSRNFAARSEGLHGFSMLVIHACMLLPPRDLKSRHARLMYSA